MYRRFFALLLTLALLLLPALAEDAGVEDCVAPYGAAASVSYYLPATGTAAMDVTDAEGHVLMQVFSERTLLGGRHMLTLDEGFFHDALAAGTYWLCLRYGGQRYEALLTVQGADGLPLLPADEAVTGAPAASAAQGEEITPALRSAYRPQHEGCYWCTPMDITDEEAVWAMLTAPITVVNAGQKEQVILRAAPSAESEGIGVITGASQAVHVLEERSDGWTLVETYSSSFHDSKVKNWNAFVTGYIESKRLETKQVNQTYGLVVDKLTQRLYIFQEGRLLTSLLASTGLYNPSQPYNETRSGEFIVISRTGDFRSDNLICRMGLRFNSGDLLHEVPHTVNADGTRNYNNCEPKLGTRASHGCIRIQRRTNPDGVNMTWVWNNIKVGTKLVVWEDYQGRQIPIPSDDTPFYYNPDGGTSYHSVPDCNGVKDKYLPLTAVPYGELESAPYASLTPCAYCAPEKRRSELEKINLEHLTSSPGEIMTLLAQEK